MILSGVCFYQFTGTVHRLSALLFKSYLSLFIQVLNRNIKYCNNTPLDKWHFSSSKNKNYGNLLRIYLIPPPVQQLRLERLWLLSLTPSCVLQCRVPTMQPASSIILRMMPPWMLPTMLASSGRIILHRWGKVLQYVWWYVTVCYQFLVLLPHHTFLYSFLSISSTCHF